MIERFGLSVLLCFVSFSVAADCVYSAKSKSKFTRLDNHTIILQGGTGGDIIVKTFCFIYATSEVQVLQDSFCSYASAVLYVDGEVCDARQVTKVG